MGWECEKLEPPKCVSATAARVPSCARAEAPARARATLSSSARGLFIKHALFQPGSHAASKPSYPLGIPRIPSRRRPHSLASEGHVRGGAPTNKRKGLSSGRRCRSALRQAARAGRQGAGSERGTCAKSPPGRSPHQNSQHSASALSHPQTKKNEVARTIRKRAWRSATVCQGASAPWLPKIARPKKSRANRD